MVSGGRGGGTGHAGGERVCLCLSRSAENCGIVEVNEDGWVEKFFCWGSCLAVFMALQSSGPVF